MATSTEYCAGVVHHGRGKQPLRSPTKPASRQARVQGRIKETMPITQVSSYCPIVLPPEEVTLRDMLLVREGAVVPAVAGRLTAWNEEPTR